MRVALINGLFPPLGIGGSEESVYHLAQGLMREGVKVTVYGENTGSEDVVEEVDGVKVVRQGTPPGEGPNIFDASYYTRSYERLQHAAEAAPAAKRERLETFMLRHFAREQPQVVHTNVANRVPQIWETARKAGLLSVHTIRSYSLLCPRRMLKEKPCTEACLGCFASSAPTRQRSASVDVVVGISQHVLNVFVRAGFFPKAHQARVIPNSYDRPPETALSADATHAFGYIGRLHPTKGVEVLLTAFLAASKERPIGRLLIAGDGNPSYVRHLQDQYAHPDVSFIGHTDKVEFFAKVKYSIVPSVWFEPFGRVFIESQNFGVPVLGSLRGGGSEIINEGKDGWLFNPTVGSLKDLMLRAHAVDDATYAAMRGFATANAERFSQSVVAKMYIEAYEDGLRALSASPTA